LKEKIFRSPRPEPKIAVPYVPGTNSLASRLPFQPFPASGLFSANPICPLFAPFSDANTDSRRIHSLYSPAKAGTPENPKKEEGKMKKTVLGLSLAADFLATSSLVLAWAQGTEEGEVMPEQPVMDVCTPPILMTS
jgi:hypothetical protein